MNLRAPPRVRLLRELLIFNVWFKIRAAIMVAVGVIILFVLIYRLALFFSISHGPTYKRLAVSPTRIKELIICITYRHWVVRGLLIVIWLL